MNIGLAIRRDESTEQYATMIRLIDASLQSCFKDKDYGEDILEITIGLLINGSESAKFFPIQPFKYEQESSFKHPVTKQRVIIKNLVSYDIKPNFELFTQMSIYQAAQYLVELFITSTQILEDNHDKFPNFNVNKFRENFADCLNNIDFTVFD